MQRNPARRFVVLALLALLPLRAVASDVLRPAPGFTGGREAGRSITLASLRGNPVLLVIAHTPRDRAFRSQMGRLRGYYERMSSRGVLCFAAFTAEGGRIPSNIPFILVNDPGSVASQYGAGNFAVAVIGPDGNLDCLSSVPLPGQRVLDLMENNASLQSLLRR